MTRGNYARQYFAELPKMGKYISVIKPATAEAYTIIQDGCETWKVSIKPRYTNRLQSRNYDDITKEYNISTAKKRKLQKNRGK